MNLRTDWYSVYLVYRNHSFQISAFPSLKMAPCSHGPKWLLLLQSPKPCSKQLDGVGRENGHTSSLSKRQLRSFTHYITSNYISLGGKLGHIATHSCKRDWNIAALCPAKNYGSVNFKKKESGYLGSDLQGPPQNKPESGDCISHPSTGECVNSLRIIERESFCELQWEWR